MTDWLMEDGERREIMSSGNSTFVYCEDNSAWIEAGETTETTPAWWRSQGWRKEQRYLSKNYQAPANLHEIKIGRDALADYIDERGKLVVPSNVKFISRKLTFHHAPIPSDYREPETGLEFVTTLIIPRETESIGTHAFSRCESLVHLALHEGLKRIGPMAFMKCIGLTSITIPHSVTKIGFYAFEGCSSLANVVMPNDSIKIGKGVFFNCPSLSEESKEYLKEKHPQALADAL